MRSWSNSSSSPLVLSDGVLTWTLSGCALLAGGVLLLIVGFLLIESWPLIASRHLLGFFLERDWYPEQQAFGLRAMLAGSLLVSGLAVLLAAPCGLVVAVWGRLYAPGLPGHLCRSFMELMAGIPSVVYGLWGLTVIVPWINHITPPGASLLAGGVVLGLMILPLVALSADAGIAQVPQTYLRAAAALGLSRWGMLTRILLPQAAPAIIAGSILQLGRALGETMAVLMVCGNVVQIPDSVFAPVRTLTANIALEMAYATGAHHTALFVSGLALLLLTIALMSLAHRFWKPPYGA